MMKIAKKRKRKRNERLLVTTLWRKLKANERQCQEWKEGSDRQIDG